MDISGLQYGYVVKNVECMAALLRRESGDKSVTLLELYDKTVA